MLDWDPRRTRSTDSLLSFPPYEEQRGLRGYVPFRATYYPFSRDGVTPCGFAHSPTSQEMGSSVQTALCIKKVKSELMTGRAKQNFAARDVDTYQCHGPQQPRSMMSTYPDQTPPKQD